MKLPRGRSRGYFLMVVLNAIVVLGIVFAANAGSVMMRDRLGRVAAARTQAWLNAQSGLAIARWKWAHKEIDAIPWNEEIVLFGNRTNLARVTIDYVRYERGEEFTRIERVAKSGWLRITVIGRHHKSEAAVTVVHSLATGEPLAVFQFGDRAYDKAPRESGKKP